MLKEEINHLEFDNPPGDATDSGTGFKVDVFDLLLELARRRRLIIGTTLVATLLAAGATLSLPNSYKSTVVILPPRQEPSASSLLAGQLGALTSLSGAGSALSLKNPNDIYSGLLLSRTIASDLVSRFDLQKRFKTKLPEDAVKALADHTQIELSKDNLIRVTVTTHDSNFSSQLANAYIDELHNLNTNLALTDSSQRRFFFQQQLDQQKVALANAEGDLRETEQRTGVVQPSGQADMVSKSIASIRGEITARQAELDSLKAFDTSENPDFIRVNAEITSLRHELSELENGAKSFTPGDIEIPTAKIPASALEYARKLREVKLQEEIYELFVKQFEAAKIDEAKTAPMIQVVDRAVPAMRKSGPPRTLITLGVAIATLFLTAFWFMFRFVFDTATENAETVAKIQLLKREMSVRA
jgi:tyrosine-protein kinase Etk/Wzc